MKVLSILIATGLLAGAYFALSGSQTDEVALAFTAYTTEYSKNYLSEDEFNFRKGIFETNLKKINEYNSKKLSSTWGTNQFTDWTDEEYKSILGYKSHRNNVEEFEELSDGQMPTNCPDWPKESIDWREEGIVTPVKNQGACGSCWAFAATAALEGAYAKQFGKLVSFSEAQLVECDKFSHGCGGGLMYNGFNHWMRNNPRTDEEYSYNEKPGKCKESSTTSDYPLLEWGYRVDITERCLYDALKHNVVSVAIRAENDVFRHHNSGIIDDVECGTELDHGVTVVGYEKTEDVWIVKNSWGPTWSEEGYVRIRRGDGMGICGINQENSQAVYDDSDYQ